MGVSVELLWKLGSGSLADWDEAIYAEIAWEILQDGDWLTLHWGYEPWFEKPPLLMWITASFYQIFGTNEFWARAASAVSGIALILITYGTGNRLYGRKVGLLSAAVLLSTHGFVFWLFGHSSGLGSEVQPAAVEVDGVDEVLFVSETPGGCTSPTEFWRSRIRWSRW